MNMLFFSASSISLIDFSLPIVIGNTVNQERISADFVKNGTKDDLFYITTNWKEGIKINHRYGHHGNTDWRDAFSGKQGITVVRYGAIAEPTSGSIQMSRPLGKYIFVTNDLEDFVTKVTRTKAEEAEFDPYAPIVIVPNDYQE